jgi:hypothetical protein
LANKSQTTIAFVDASGTFGASAVQVLAADPGRAYLMISNVGNATMWINFNGTAAANTAGSHAIAAGASYAPSGGVVPANAISLIGTNGQPFTVSYVAG